MPLATRMLKLRINGSEIKVAVILLAPQPGPKGGWFCSYSIGWPDSPRRSQGWGIDAVQAIQLTLQSIGTDLYTSSYHAEGQLVWESAGDGYGFPVPSNLQKLLVGTDREYGGA